MSLQKSPQQLSKILSYILERRPDEFGLILDAEGYIKIKELLKAFGEEEGWKHVRRSHLDEILLTLTNPLFEINDNRIRAKNRQQLPAHTPAVNLPKILYTCVRTRAYPVVIEKGIFPTTYPQVLLSSSREMAERIGRRMDTEPVLLIVQVQKSIQEGIIFYQNGETLFLADYIPAACFTGPPMPKQREESKKSDTMIPESRPLPGSFFIDLNRDPDQKKQFKQQKKKDKISREKDRKWRRKQKQNQWPE